MVWLRLSGRIPDLQAIFTVIVMDITDFLLAYSAGMGSGFVLCFASWAIKAIYRSAKLFFNY